MVRPTVQQAGQPVGEESIPPEQRQPGIVGCVSVRHTVSCKHGTDKGSHHEQFFCRKSVLLSVETGLALSGRMAGRAKKNRVLVFGFRNELGSGFSVTI